jgi:hypothetical protein
VPTGWLVLSAYVSRGPQGTVVSPPTEAVAADVKYKVPDEGDWACTAGVPLKAEVNSNTAIVNKNPVPKRKRVTLVSRAKSASPLPLVGRFSLDTRTSRDGSVDGSNLVLIRR